MFLSNILVICCALILVNADEAPTSPTTPPPPPDLQIRRYEMCPDLPNTPAKFSTTITRKTPTIFVISAQGSSPYDVGEDMNLDIVAETWDEASKTWNVLLNTTEKDPCALLNNYVGESWHKIEAQLKIPVEKCPIPKGEYSMKDYELDLESVGPVTSIPKGRARFRSKILKGDEIVMCVEAEVESL